ncbi:MAG: inositol monophosphatase family protein, partial [Spirochaetota bacterium]
MAFAGDELRRFAVSLAREAGDLTLRYFRGDLTVETKSDDTPVTRADREAETLIRARLRRAYPGDDILGEELGTDEGRGERTWVVDPIDGTKSFVAGAPLYAVLIALVDGRYSGGDLPTDRVLLGVIHVPPLRETVSAVRGGGALWE